MLQNLDITILMYQDDFGETESEEENKNRTASLLLTLANVALSSHVCEKKTIFALILTTKINRIPSSVMKKVWLHPISNVTQKMNSGSLTHCIQESGDPCIKPMGIREFGSQWVNLLCGKLSSTCIS